MHSRACFVGQFPGKARDAHPTDRPYVTREACLRMLQRGRHLRDEPARETLQWRRVPSSQHCSPSRPPLANGRPRDYYSVPLQALATTSRTKLPASSRAARSFPPVPAATPVGVDVWRDLAPRHYEGERKVAHKPPGARTCVPQPPSARPMGNRSDAPSIGQSPLRSAALMPSPSSACLHCWPVCGCVKT